MKNSIYSPKLGHFSQFPIHLFVSAMVCCFFLFFLSDKLYADLGGGEMSVSVTFNAISNKTTYVYYSGNSDMGQFKTHHFNNDGEAYWHDYGGRIGRKNAEERIRSILTSSTSSFNAECKTINVGISGNILYAGSSGNGAINFGSTRRPKSWGHYNSINSGIDNHGLDNEYVALDYLGLYSAGRDKKNIAISSKSVSGWENFYKSNNNPIRIHEHVSGYWEPQPDKCETDHNCHDIPKSEMNWYAGKYGTESCRQFLVIPANLLDFTSCQSGEVCGVGCGSCSDPSNTNAAHWNEDKTTCTPQDDKWIPEENGYWSISRTNLGVGHAGCEFVPNSAATYNKFSDFGFDDCATHLYFNSTDDINSSGFYKIPHALHNPGSPNNSGAKRLVMVCLGVGIYDEGTGRYGSIKAPERGQVARLFCLEAPGSVDKKIDFRRFDIYYGNDDTPYKSIEDSIAIVAVPERVSGSNIRIEAVYRVKEFDVAVQKYVKTNRSTHNYAGTTIPDSFHIKNALLPSYNSDSISTTTP